MLRRTFRYLVLAITILCLPNVSGAVIVGNPVVGDNSSIWTSTVLFTSPSGSICSSTVIGARVILTAASCTESLQAGDPNDKKQNYAKIGDTLFALSCEQHPAYKTDPSADFALCLATHSFTSSNIERINTDQKKLSLGTNVTMVGYGCRVKDGIDRRLGELTKGNAIINKLPDQTTQYAIVTGAVACFGDSGGGTYLSTPEKRILVGVNSRSDLREQSWISLTSSQTFLEWARRWATVHQVGLCGISDEASCHFETTFKPTPTPPSSSAASNAAQRLSILPDSAST